MECRAHTSATFTLLPATFCDAAVAAAKHNLRLASSYPHSCLPPRQNVTRIRLRPPAYWYAPACWQGVQATTLLIQLGQVLGPGYIWRLQYHGSPVTFLQPPMHQTERAANNILTPVIRECVTFRLPHERHRHGCGQEYSVSRRAWAGAAVWIPWSYQPCYQHSVTPLRTHEKQCTVTPASHP